jgi:predicted dehydrogenase
VATSVRIGLCGYGSGGRVFHAPLIASAPGCELAGVVTRSPERRGALARDHPGTPAYGSLADLAAAGVEAVAISTPAATHVELTRQAIGLGLAVVCDKPFALDAAAARETVLLAEREGVTLSVYQNRRWDCDLLTVRGLIAAGALGEVRRFESRFERFAPQRGPKESGGGTLLDFGSHLADQALVLFGPVHAVYAELNVPAGRRWAAGAGSAEGEFFAALHHRSGVLSHLWGSLLQGAPGPRLRVAGAAGSYVVDGVDGQEAALVAGRSPATEGERWGAEPPQRWGWLHRGEAREQVPSQRGRWDTFYPAFAAAVRGRGEVPVNPWDAVASLQVLDAARTSAVAGRVVGIDS